MLKKKTKISVHKKKTINKRKNIHGYQKKNEWIVVMVREKKMEA